MHPGGAGHRQDQVAGAPEHRDRAGDPLEPFGHAPRRVVTAARKPGDRAKSRTMFAAWSGVSCHGRATATASSAVRPGAVVASLSTTGATRRVTARWVIRLPG